MVKFLLIVISFFIFNCNKRPDFYNADLEMYVEYLEYIKLTSKGKLGIAQFKQKNKEIEYSIKDFYKINTKVLTFYDKKLNIQYFVFYSNFIEKNQGIFLKVRITEGFNSEIMNIASEVENFIIEQFNDKAKKIFIGFEAGGAIANIMASRFAPNKDFEVITFGTPSFSYGFKPKFKSVNIILEEDDIALIDPKCCSKFEVSTTSFSSNKSTKGATKIEAYQDGIRATLK